MTTTKYKVYSILTIGISRYIYRPGASVPNSYHVSTRDAAGHETTINDAKRWVNRDIALSTRLLNF